MDLSIPINWKVHSSFKGCQVSFFSFILFQIEIPMSKQCRPGSDAAFCGDWSGSALFTYVPEMGRQAYRKCPKYWDTPKICCNHSKIWTLWLYHREMSSNDTDGIANSVDSSRSNLIWVCTVCPGISARKLRIITVYGLTTTKKTAKQLLQSDILKFVKKWFYNTEMCPKHADVPPPHHSPKGWWEIPTGKF